MRVESFFETSVTVSSARACTEFFSERFVALGDQASSKGFLSTSPPRSSDRDDVKSKWQGKY